MIRKVNLRACWCNKCKHEFNAIDLPEVQSGCFSGDDTSDLRCPKCSSTSISGAKNSSRAKWSRVDGLSVGRGK